MKRAFDRAAGWTVARPLLTLAIIVAISTIAGIGHTRPELLTQLWEPKAPAEPVRFNTRESEQTPRDPEPPPVQTLQLTNFDAVLLVESDSFFTPRGAEALRHLVDTLSELDYVDEDILWLDKIPNINLFGLNEPIFPSPRASVRQFEHARKRALEHPLIKGQLLSADGRALLIMVRFDWIFVRDDDDVTSRLKEVAQQAVADYEDLDFRFHVTGRVPIILTALQTRDANQLRFQIIGYSMTLIMAVVLFRGLVPVLVLALAPTMGVIWTLGFLPLLELNDNPFNDVVLPVLLSMVGLTDGVHLMVCIRRFRAEGHSPRESARRGIAEVGLACGLTSLTTAIGFGSLMLAHHEVVQDFGLACVIGVLLMFVAVITVIPLACSTWVGRFIHTGHARSVLDRNLTHIRSIVHAVLRRRRVLSYTAIAATILLAAVCTTLRPDERNANALPGNSEAAVGMRRLDKVLGGLETAQISIHWDRAVPSDSPEVMRVVMEVDDLLRREPMIGHPLSIRNLVDALPGEGKADDRMSMLQLLPASLKRAFYTPERRSADVAFRVQDVGIARYGPVFERIEEGLTAIQQAHPQFSLDLRGDAAWRWRNLYQIVVDLAASLGSATIIIFLVLALVYRSLRIGLVSIVPNLFPLVMTGVFLVVTGQALEIVSVCAFTVCLGIAVDDTIHFLTRFHEEQQESSDELLATERAFSNVGTAMIMTTIVLVAGLSTVLFSDARDHRIFATMGIFTIASALFADLIFLPAMLAYFVRRK